MRPVPALTTVAPLAGGLVLPPVLPASDGDGDPLLVVTAGDTVVGVLIVKKPISFQSVPIQNTCRVYSRPHCAESTRRNAGSGLDVKLRRLSEDGVGFVNILDEVDPKVGTDGPTSARWANGNLSLPNTVLLSH